MGNCQGQVCCNMNAQQIENNEQQMLVLRREDLQAQKKSERLDNMKSAQTRDTLVDGNVDLELFKSNEDQIVKIQKSIRRNLEKRKANEVGLNTRTEGSIVISDQFKNFKGQLKQYEIDSCLAKDPYKQYLIDGTEEQTFVPFLKLANNTEYEGQWQGGLKHGFGELRMGKYTVYTGDWVNNKASGNGILVLRNKKGQEEEYYEGEWFEDLANGQGKYKSSKFTYQGEWRNDMFEGFGKLEVFKETQYEGEFLNGVYHGKGQLMFYHDRSVFEGEFLNGYMDGQGVYKHNDKTYDGTWKKNKMHGQFKVTYGDSMVFTGRYENDKKNGQGEILWKSGKRFVATFKNGFIDGQGCLYHEDGTVKKGTWVQGLRKK